MARRKQLDYFQLPRKRLQSLCKKHGYPANATTERMAKFLTAYLNTEESERGRHVVAYKSRKTSAERVSQPLLPGIPHNNTLTNITSKLSWRDLHTLYSVSPSWQHAIESREVYNERVRTHSTETFAVLHVIQPGHLSSWTIRSSGNVVSYLKHVRPDHDDDTHKLSFYSFNGKCSFDAPPIPFCEGVPSACQHVALDGKLYVLGGMIDRSDYRGSKEVYVLDVAGLGKWTRCAPMHIRRLDFAACVLDGKIYVFGGRSSMKPVRMCEVYDPQVDSWTQIKSMPKGRANHKAVILGEEIFLYGGRSIGDVGGFFPGPAYDLNVYHPVMDRWREIIPSNKVDWDSVFKAQGKLSLPTSVGIGEYDVDNDSWIFLNPYPGYWPVCQFQHGYLAHRDLTRFAAVGDEVLLADGFGERQGLLGCCLFLSAGFGSQNEASVWEKKKCCIFLDSKSTFMYPIQL